MKNDEELTNSNLMPNNSSSILGSSVHPPLMTKKSRTISIKESHTNDIILEALTRQRKEVFSLEKDLYECLNLQWGEDIITEDIPIIDGIHGNYYMHLLRTAKPDPNKENFLLIHGFLSSNLFFLGILPYLIKRYNVFAPDTIGMGLSARPQIKFTTPFQCEEYFMGIYHLFIKSLFFEDRFNIKKEYYLCGHSLGGFLASRYMLRYPEGIKKVLLLSPAGITDYNIPGTDFFQGSTCCFYCSAFCCSALVWPCRLRIQSLYNCCICHKFIKKYYEVTGLQIEESEIKKNKDGSKFKVDYETLKYKISRLSILSLDYPKDLYRCAYFLFKAPPPAAFYPIEKQLMYDNKIPIIFVFGEYDWMDKLGSYRLCKFDSEKYKIFSVSKGGHSFANENPKELCSIINEFFEQ
jgi:pimeloyl-ACP methyl ester carboxylesterase